jgi:hypothetical protein
MCAYRRMANPSNYARCSVALSEYHLLVKLRLMPFTQTTGYQLTGTADSSHFGKQIAVVI